MKFETYISTNKGDGLVIVTFTSENWEQAEEAADAMNIWSFHRVPEEGQEVTETRWKSIRALNAVRAGCCNSVCRKRNQQRQ